MTPSVGYLIVLLLTVGVPIFMIGDLLLGRYLEKKWYFYPCLKFHCYCGRTFTMNSLMFKTTYDVLKCYYHINHCLVYLLRYDPDLIPYYNSNMQRHDWSLIVVSLREKSKEIRKTGRFF